ncbi:MAG: RluA family pseudouridine synthase [Clostridiales bacterium]|nr:RluA family pseudouridine synthase [Clostridiales bacterium]
MKEFKVSSREAGQRMDKYLFKVLNQAPDSFVYKMLRKKNITLNGKKASGKELLQAQDCVRIFLSDETFSKFSSIDFVSNSAAVSFGQKSDEGIRKSGSALETNVFDNQSSVEMKGNILNPEHAAAQAGIAVVYEDDDILVIDKPAGLLSQKARAGDDSANDRILTYLLASGQLTEEELRTFHPSICNRLDRNTSGLLLAGKTMRGLQDMAAQLKSRSVKKYYHALVWGEMTEPQHLSGYLVKDHRTNQVRVFPELSRQKADTAKIHPETRLPEEKNGRKRKDETKERGSYAGESRIETAYRPLAHFGNATLLEIHLITGKSHQIRAHLASVGHPILGDPKYGDPAGNRRLREKTGIKRQLLHACRVELADGRVIGAEDPEDFRRAEKWLQSS